MSDFQAGQYVIRFLSQSDSELAGGGVATGLNKPDLPVRLEVLSTDKLQFQNWAAKPTEHGQWIIESWNDGSVYGGILNIKDPSRPPTGPVITTTPPAPGSSEKVQHWIVSPIGINGLDNTFTIQPATGAVGVDYYVGVECGELYIRTFDIREPHPKPYFQFIRIAKE